MYSQKGNRQSVVLSLLQRVLAAAGTAGRSTVGKQCRTQAYTAYPGIVSACLLNESTALQFLMSPTT